MKRRQLETLHRAREGEADASVRQLGKRVEESAAVAGQLAAQRAKRDNERAARREVSIDQHALVASGRTRAEDLLRLAAYEQASRQREVALSHQERQVEGELRTALEREERARGATHAAKADARVSQRALELQQRRERAAQEQREHEEALDGWSARGRAR